MAKKKNSQGYDTSEFIKLPNLEKEQAVEEETQHTVTVLNGKAVGLYYDETLKRYVVVTLDLSPENDSAIIINKKVLTGSKIAAMMTAEVDLKKVIDKDLKQRK